MSFYIMRQDAMIDGVRSLDCVPDDIDKLDWVQGKYMPPPKENLVLNLSLESGDYRGDILGGFLTLYSDELKEALESQGVDNVLYYPVRLMDQNTEKTEGGYWLVNIIGLYDCVDMGKSKVKHWASGVNFHFESIVIDEKKTNGAKIFRLKDKPTAVVINEELKKFFDETDMLVGVELIKTEDYSDW